MIDLFVSDIDGCLAVGYQPYDLDALGRLRQGMAYDALGRRDQARARYVQVLEEAAGRVAGRVAA